MVMHWSRTGVLHAHSSMLINGLGALVTAATTLVVMVSKFTEGAWLTVLLIPGIVLVMKKVRGHYERLMRALSALASAARSWPEAAAGDDTVRSLDAHFRKGDALRPDDFA